jgi:DNA-binding NtrC family response regulator
MESLISEMVDGRIMLGEAMSEFENLYIREALSRNGDRISETAAALGIHRNTLSKKATMLRRPERGKGEKLVGRKRR